MKTLEAIKERKVKVKRKNGSIYLPVSEWEKWKNIAHENNVSLSDVVEEALIRFERDIAESNTMPTQTA